jgi:ABC-type uncharacterized transport system substrate-binding protein
MQLVAAEARRAERAPRPDSMDTYAEHAAELVKGQVDVIIASGDAAVSAAQQATKTIPILANATDMVGSGFVASLRPIRYHAKEFADWGNK